MAFAEDYQELHHGEQEYCRNSGPLNSRTIETPAAALLNGLELVAAALAAAVLAALIAAITILSAPLAIYSDGAVINVKIQNRPEGIPIEYTLTEFETPETVLLTGILDADEETLRFQDLKSGTAYLITYYSREDGVLTKLDEFKFITASNVQGTPPSGPAPGGTPGGNESSPADPGTDTPEEIKTTDPTKTTEPTEPSKPVQPPYIPDDSPDDEPSAPAAPSGLRADTPVLDSSQAVPDREDNLAAYLCQQTHTFRDVTSDANTVRITQDGYEVSDYTASYDAASKTLTVTFTGEPIFLGETSTGTVTLTDETGKTVTSSKEITVPALNAVTLTPTVLGADGSVSFDISGSAQMPSEGTLRYEFMIYPDQNNYSLSDSVLMSTSQSSYSHTFSFDLDNPPNGTLTALVEVYCVWSLDSVEYPMRTKTQAYYSFQSDSAMTFTLDVPYWDDSLDPPRESRGYSVQAQFAGLDFDNIDPDTVTVAFTGDIYERTYEGDFVQDDTAPWQDLQIEIDTDAGTVTASVMSPDTMYAMDSRQTRWQAVLTYQDLEGISHTATLTDIIALGMSQNPHTEAVIRKDGSGNYIVEYMAQHDTSFTNPGTWEIRALLLNNRYYYASDGLTEESDGNTFSYRITLPMEPADNGYFDLTSQPHFDWTATSYIEYFCPAINGKGFGFESELTGAEYNDRSGTWSATETHIFRGIDPTEFAADTFDFEFPAGVADVSKVYDETTGEYRVSFLRTGIEPGTSSTVSMTNTYRYGKSTSVSTVTYPDAPGGFSLRTTVPAAIPASQPQVTQTTGVSTSPRLKDVTLNGSSWSYVEEHTFSGISGYVLNVELHRNGYVSSVPYSIRRDGNTFTVTLAEQTLDRYASADSRVVIRWTHTNGDPCTTQSTLSITNQLLESSLS